MDLKKREIIQQAINDWRTDVDFDAYIDEVKKLLNVPIASSVLIQKWIDQEKINSLNYAWEIESLTTLLEIGEFEDMLELKKYLQN